MRTATLGLFAIIVMLAVMIAGLSPGASGASTTTVDVGDFYFCSGSFQNGVCDTTVTAEDTVTWEVSGGVHTVTECDAAFTTCPPSGGFDSGLLSSGGAFSRTFSASGTYEYQCSFHPSQMRGRVIVQPATPTPSPSPTATLAPSGSSATPTSPAGAPAASPAAIPASGGPRGERDEPWALITGLPAVLVLGSCAVAIFAPGRPRAK